MSLKIATLIAHDGKTLVKVNPLQVDYLVSPRSEFAKDHFGLDQAVDVTGELEAVEKVLSGV